MAKKLSTSNRINIIFALTVVFLMVFLTNRIDKNHFETAQQTLTAIHQDRVLAQDYIYRMNTILHKKYIQIQNDTLFVERADLNTNFQSLIDDFASTKLTTQESKTFRLLIENFNKLTATETKVIDSKNLMASKETFNKLFIDIQGNLDTLSETQVSESKNLKFLAQKSLDSNQMMSNFEIGFLVIIGILIQFILFYRVKKT